MYLFLFGLKAYKRWWFLIQQHEQFGFCIHDQQYAWLACMKLLERYISIYIYIIYYVIYIVHMSWVTYGCLSFILGLGSPLIPREMVKKNGFPFFLSCLEWGELPYPLTLTFLFLCFSFLFFWERWIVKEKTYTFGRIKSSFSFPSKYIEN